MIGGIEETSASFEARSAPRSYPILPDHHQAALAVKIVAVIARGILSKRLQVIAVSQRFFGLWGSGAEAAQGGKGIVVREPRVRKERKQRSYLVILFLRHCALYYFA